MAGDSGAGERTEAPTPKRLREARKEGRVARSGDLGAWVGIAAAALVLPMVVRHGQDALTDLLVGVRDVTRDPQPATALAALSIGLRQGALIVAPLAAVGVAVAIGAAASQGGIHFATKAARPQAKRLNPVTGFKRLFGPHTLWEAAKAALKTAVLAVVLWRTVQSLVPHVLGAGSMPLTAVLGIAKSGTVDLLRSAVIAGIVVAAADYVVVRRRTMKQLRMSRKEVQEEHKQTEGDPQLKGAIRSKQLAMSRNRMMAEVAKADVVLVNPTHVAVALRYEPEKGAPRVVAKGAGAVAAKIRERASEHRVPLVEDVPLARAIHGACELGQEIPVQFYTAVAQVLAFVMRLRSRGAAGGTHRLPRGRRDVA